MSAIYVGCLRNLDSPKEFDRLDSLRRGVAPMKAYTHRQEDSLWRRAALVKAYTRRQEDSLRRGAAPMKAYTR
jgi:hypothetical protein